MAPPSYQPPPAPFPPQGAPGQFPPPYLPVVAAGAGIGLMSQFSGDALWSTGLGLVSIIVPFFLNRVFFFLPLIGLYYGIRAIRRGRVIGGIVGIVLCCIGGLVTLIGLFAG
jgi:hypothetical protein